MVVDVGTGSGAIALSLAVELGPGLRARGLGHRHQRRRLAVATANVAGAGGARPARCRRSSSCAGAGSSRCRLGCVARSLGRVEPSVRERGRVGRLERRGAGRAARTGGRPASDGTPGLGDVEAVLVEVRGLVGRSGAVWSSWRRTRRTRPGPGRPARLRRGRVEPTSPPTASPGGPHRRGLRWPAGVGEGAPSACRLSSGRPSWQRHWRPGPVVALPAVGVLLPGGTRRARPRARRGSSLW